MNKRHILIGILAGCLVGTGGLQVFAKSLKYPLDIKFETNKAELKADPNNTRELKKFAHELQSYPYAKLEIEGYADATGPADYNQKLSLERAEAVRQKMIQDYKIPSDRIHAVGMGEKYPAADNTTTEGRQENRRVIATVYRIDPAEPGLPGSRL